MWNSDDDSDDEDMIYVLRPERRAYSMRERINLDSWDDVDFFSRFRLKKATVLMVHDIIRRDLEYDEPR